VCADVRRLLLVDDDAESLSAFAELLRTEGAEVDLTTSPLEALRPLENGQYDVVLSDLSMPKMSGLEFIARARASEPAKPFRAFAVTGESGEESVRDVLAAGLDGHISKPVSLERLRLKLTP
jgi:two-component system CheB/CheR fusion protein